jgi:cytochrome c oxidase cbb3-type subunit 3
MTPPRALTDQSEDASIPYKARHDGHVFVGGNAPAAKSISNPLHGDAKSIEAGKQLFTSMHCDGCHGLGALGWEGPSLADGRWHYGASSAEIFESIYAGRPNGMPAYGGTLPRHSLWQLVTYLQSLTPATDPATTRYPP